MVDFAEPKGGSSDEESSKGSSVPGNDDMGWVCGVHRGVMGAYQGMPLWGLSPRDGS